jgi:transmembrane sensor
MADALDLAARTEAAVWLARMRSEARTPADELGFQAWLAEDARHRHAFDLATTMFEAAGAAPVEAGPRGRNRQVQTDRRRVFVGGVLAAASVAAVGVGWRLLDASTYRTGVGEQRRLTLADGSQVILDTHSVLRVAMSGDHRRVELASGRAHFDVAKDPTRPFIVRAGGRDVIAVGTAFSVQHDGPATAVVLEEGRVIVQPVAAAGARRPSAQARPMVPGDRLVFASAAAPPVADRPDLGQALAWQEGRAVFENETLAGAALELNRYTRRTLDVTDPAVASLRVSGVFRTGDPEAFARTVALLLPVEVDARDDRIVLRPRKIPSEG